MLLALIINQITADDDSSDDGGGGVTCNSQCATCEPSNPNYCLTCSDPSDIYTDGSCKSCGELMMMMMN